MIILNLLLISVLSFANFEPPALTRPVVDQAGLLKPAESQKLNHLLTQVYNSGGPQFAILTVESLNGSSLFDASFKTAEKWALGTEKDDKGLLIFIAKQERKIRIEVGQGLEGDIPDIITKRAIDQIMTPNFKRGQFSQGIYLATLALLKRAAPDLKLNERVPNIDKSNRRFSMGSVFDIIFLIIGLIIFIFNPRLLLYGMFFGGGRGGLGGGGGFSGGGGGFSGGGASGGW